jgi:serine/threonine protein kinase
MPELKLENSLVDERYEVRERLGRGSYAEIFVARDREANGMDVVIKALNTSLQGTPDADLERTLIENFQSEAELLDVVRHPHVILRWGHGTAADLRSVPFHYLVLEYMPGGDLLKLCRERENNSLSLEEALYFFKQASEALAFAHGKGIIHRDLKPNNFLLSADHRTLKIADFGVAKIASGEDTEITRVGADIYAPPEHNPFEEPGQTDRLTASADVYSLAKSFYTVICGRAPNQFRCDPITYLPEEITKKSWGPALRDVLRRATDDDPTKRYATVIEFWGDLVQVAAIAEETPADEETIVKPRLKINPGELPKRPSQPEFEPTLASLGSHAHFTSATPVRPRPERDLAEANDRRDGKFFVDLQRPKPSPVIEERERQQQPSKQAREQPEKNGEAKPELSFTERFTETVRRRTFLILVALALLGANVSIFNYVRDSGMPFGFGQPTEIEVTAPGLNVRSGPSPRDAILGVIGKGSRHRVRAKTNHDWLQIEVSQWDESISHVTGQNQGWVYGNLDGNPSNVRVVSRRFW